MARTMGMLVRWDQVPSFYDVNLAVQLLHDAHLNRFDCAAIVGGDSDLMMRSRLGGRDASFFPVNRLDAFRAWVASERPH